MELDVDTLRREVGAVFPETDTTVSISRAVVIEDPAEDEEIEESGDGEAVSPSSDSGGHI
jgi:hypothetical protein